MSRANNQLRIATYNIHGGRDGTPARRHSLDAIIRVIASVSPDVCVLQEVDRYLARSRFVDQARRIARELPGGPWHFAFYGRLDFGPIGAFGNAILSRAPFVGEVRRLPLPSSGGEPRGAVGVRIGERLAIWNTHLGLRDDWRASQLAALADVVKADIANGSRVIVGGDFNDRLDSKEVAAFLTRTGLASLTPHTPTYPADAPAHAIDFLLGSPTVRANGSGRVAAPEASDHCLLWAQIDL